MTPVEQEDARRRRWLLHRPFPRASSRRPGRPNATREHGRTHPALGVRVLLRRLDDGAASEASARSFVDAGPGRQGEGTYVILRWRCCPRAHTMRSDAHPWQRACAPTRPWTLSTAWEADPHHGRRADVCAPDSDGLRSSACVGRHRDRRARTHGAALEPESPQSRSLRRRLGSRCQPVRRVGLRGRGDGDLPGCEPVRA